MPRMDLDQLSYLPHRAVDFEAGAAEFLALLDRLKAVPGFDVDWIAQWEENGSLYDARRDREVFLQRFRDHNADGGDMFSIWAHADPERIYDIDFSWGAGSIDLLTLEVLTFRDPASHPGASSYIPLIKTVIGWKRPQHLVLRPGLYNMNYHPLDRARLGIGWIGWLPFTLTPADVPEAELVQPLAGGTLVVSQDAFWQAHPPNPHFSQAAIARAQDVDIRLNLLGVLPTADDLRRGGWGQG